MLCHITHAMPLLIYSVVSLQMWVLTGRQDILLKVTGTSSSSSLPIANFSEMLPATPSLPPPIWLRASTKEITIWECSVDCLCAKYCPSAKSILHRIILRMKFGQVTVLRSRSKGPRIKSAKVQRFKFSISNHHLRLWITKISCAPKAMKPPLCSMTRVYSQSQGNSGITFWQIGIEK